MTFGVRNILLISGIFGKIVTGVGNEKRKY